MRPLNFIDGSWRPSANGATFENRDPATGELIDVYPESSAADVDAAVAAASRAFDSWRRVPAPKRGELLLATMRLLEERKEAMARELTREMGKILAEARGDVQEAIDTALYFAGEGRRLFGETTTSELPQKLAMSVRRPVGVCGLITPWNFPVAIPSWKIFPALLCGNTVVLKPSPLTPGCAKSFVAALEEAGAPPGVVNLVHGVRAGEALCSHPDVRLVSFTGSTVVGARVGETCGRHLKKCSLEMGGKNAQIVLADADLELALEGALWGAFGTTGQRCTATSRILVEEEVFSTFAERLAARCRALVVGGGLDPATQMGPLASADQLRKTEDYVRIGLSEDGATLLAGGAALRQGALAHGFFHEPTLFEARPGMRIATEEIFGPVAVLMRVRSFEEAIRVLNSSEYGLSGSIYSRDVNRVMRAIDDMETGITYVNAPTIGAEVHLPFGGVKRTGNGYREAGTAALETYSEWKAVYIDYSGRLQKAQMDGRKPPP
jgi:aldehyde dehydrogenase (NAD+)